MFARNTPSTPWMIKQRIKLKLKSIGVLSLSLPPYKVATQLKIFTPDGIAIAIVMNINGTRAVIDNPLVHIWCAQTPKPKNPINAVETAIELYPKIWRLDIEGNICEINPIPGKTMM